MYLIKKKNKKIWGTDAKEVSMFDGKYKDILSLLAKKPMYAKQLATELSISEQHIYYYIKQLSKKGLIHIHRKENTGGVVRKYYKLKSPCFCTVFEDLKPMNKIPSDQFKPFIKHGALDCNIVVGSLDPHGPGMVRSRDAYYGIDLALFLGTFLHGISESKVYLDTNIETKDLEENLIILGGPITNKITKKINKHLSIKFKKNGSIYSKITKKTYSQDETGLIVETQNPYNQQKKVLVIAGKGHPGTRAAILAFLQKFDQIKEGNKKNSKYRAKVIEGIDQDGDGIVDKVKIRE